MNSIKFLLYISSSVLFKKILSAPPEACFANFRSDDCGMPAKPVMYYYKPGSRCEVGFWKGCLPNINMFPDEYTCVRTCIFAERVRPEDYHDIQNINANKAEPATATTPESADANEVALLLATEATNNNATEPTGQSATEASGATEATNNNATEPTGRNSTEASGATEATNNNATEPTGQSATEPREATKATNNNATEPTGRNATKASGATKATNNNVTEPTGQNATKSSGATEPTGSAEPTTTTAAAVRLGKECLAVDEYFPEAGGWLRLHDVPLTWSDARLRCHFEGGMLASPTSNALTTALMKMMNADIQSKKSVFTGFHASVLKGNFTSIDGVPLSSVSLQWADGEPNNVANAEDCLVMTGAGELADVSCGSVHPYFCYINNTVTYGSAEKGTGYALEPRTGSWYKFHPEGRSWRQAAMACAAEGARLAVINSDLESQVLKELFAKYPASKLQGVYNDMYAHIGFWDWNEKREFLTIFGETFAEAGFGTWDTTHDDEPNGPTSEFCGSIARNGLLNDIPCVSKRFPFICEITLNTPKP